MVKLKLKNLFRGKVQAHSRLPNPVATRSGSKLAWSTVAHIGTCRAKGKDIAKVDVEDEEHDAQEVLSRKMTRGKPGGDKNITATKSDNQGSNLEDPGKKVNGDRTIGCEMETRLRTVFWREIRVDHLAGESSEKWQEHWGPVGESPCNGGWRKAWVSIY